MAGEQELILELFKDGKEFSTSEVVNHLYSEELATDSSFENRARLHRKLIYHLNRLVDKRILRVSGYQSKGEKLFKAARDVIVELPHNKVVISNKQIQQIDLSDDSVLEYQPFGIMVNAITLNAKNLELSQLSGVIKDLIKEVNDVIAIHNAEHLLATSSIEELSHFFTGISRIIDNRKISLLIDYSNPKAHYLSKAYNSLKDNDNIEVVLLLKEEDFLAKTKELTITVDALRNAGLKINISVKGSQITFSGNAGAYSTKLRDDLVSLVSINSVCLDIAALKALPAKKINDNLMKVAKALHQINAHQQLDSEDLFPIIKSYGAKLSTGTNTIRFWNYNWKTDEYLLELLEEIKEDLQKFAINQERIYVSAGMPVNFRIELGSAFNSFDREKLSSRDYDKGVIRNFSDLTTNYSGYIKLRNKYFSLFDHDRLRIFRQNSDSKELLKEFHHLITSNTPYFTYDFRSLSKEINLRDFM